MITISFQVVEQEARAILMQAKREGLSVSEFLRRKACPPPAPRLKQRTVRCRRTGARIFAGDENLPPLTTKTVRGLLGDLA